MKKHLSIVSVLLLSWACNKPANDVSEQSQNEAIVRKNFEFFNQHDWKGMANTYTDTVAIKDPSIGTEMVKQTKADIEQKYGELHKMIPDVHDDVKTIHHAGKHVIVEFISTGTGPDGKPFSLPICTIFKIENGLITEDFTYYDNK
jgi:ketosteroid isomerase-like protein